MNRPAPDPRRNKSGPSHPDQPVKAELVNPIQSLPEQSPFDIQVAPRTRRPQVPRAQPLQAQPVQAQPLQAQPLQPLPAPLPGQPEPYDWTLLAVLSWVLALLAGFVALIMVVVNGDQRLWYWWLAICGLLGMGFMASLTPLNTRGRGGWTGTHYTAVGGLVFTICSCCWCLVCMGMIALAKYARSEQGRQHIQAIAEESRRREQEQQAQLRREADERRRAEEQRRINEALAARQQAIDARDAEAAQRFQQAYWVQFP